MAKQKGLQVRTHTHKKNISNNNNSNKNYNFFYNILSIIIIIISLMALYFYDNFWSSPLSFIGSFLFTSSLVLLYLDDFKFSNSKIIKVIQIFSIFFIPILFLVYIFSKIDLDINTISHVNDKRDIHLHGHVSLDETGAQVIGNTIGSVGSNIGLGASITGVALAGSKAIAKASVPPFQKIAMIGAAGALGGITHLFISTANKSRAIEISKYNTNALNDNVNKFVDDKVSDPLLDMLNYIQMTSYVCISLIIILSIQLIMRSMPDKINSLNENINYYINKIIALNKKMSIIYSFIVIVLLFYGLGLIISIENELHTNIDMYVSIHNKLGK